jgi:membrane protein DedA with SNARE-associated domain
MDEFYPLIEHYGYLIVFFGVVLGTMGVPFPSAAILLVSGVLVQQGHQDLRNAYGGFSCPTRSVLDCMVLAVGSECVRR